MLDHFEEYFILTGKTMRDTDGEFVETVHQSFKKYKVTHGTKRVRNLGTPDHVKQSKKTLLATTVVGQVFPQHRK